MGFFFKKKNYITIINAFQKILDKPRRKPINTWVHKFSEFYNRSITSWLQDNNIEMFSKLNKGKFVVAERFIRTLKNEIYKYMTSISKNVYIDKLDDRIDEYKNTYRTTKMKPTKYKNNFAKGYTPNWSEEAFMINIKNNVTWTYVIEDLNGEEIVGMLYEKELQKTNQVKFRVEKVIKEK